MAPDYTQKELFEELEHLGHIKTDFSLPEDHPTSQPKVILPNPKPKASTAHLACPKSLQPFALLRKSRPQCYASIRTRIVSPISISLLLTASNASAGWRRTLCTQCTIARLVGNWSIHDLVPSCRWLLLLLDATVSARACQPSTYHKTPVPILLRPCLAP